MMSKFQIVMVDKIRLNGNDATHKIKIPDKKSAENTLSFTMMLLRIIYEMEHWADKYTSSSSSS